MRINFILCTLIISLFLLGSCKQPATSTKEPAAKSTPSGKKSSLKPPSLDFVKRLHEECDFIDYIFDDFSFSVSVKKRSSVQGNIGYLTIAQVEDINCARAIGSIYYQAKGDHIAEARVFFNPKTSCGYFVFLDKSNRPQYASNMSDSGKTFFAQVHKTSTTPAPGN